MAKKPTITTVASGFQSTATINNNFQNLRDAFDNTLSLDGSTPNAMNADLDMNGNDIINVGSANGNAILTVNTGDARYVNTSGDTMTGSLNTPALYTNGLYINGNPVLPSTLTYNGIVKETKIATSGQTVFNLSSISYTPGINNLAVYVDGVYQRPANYTENSATQVTFSVGIHVGGIVDFVVLTINSLSGTADAVNLTYTPSAQSLYGTSTLTLKSALDQISNEGTGSSKVGFLQSGTGAANRTTQAKLRDTISVKDFGAVGDNSTDDTANIQAAIKEAVSSKKHLIFPTGTYVISSTLLIPNNPGFSSQIIIDGQGSIIKPSSDITIFASGRYNASNVLIPTYGETVDVNFCFGITLQNFTFTSISNVLLLEPAIEIQNWNTGCRLFNIISRVHNEFLKARSCFYCDYENLWCQTATNTGVVRFLFDSNNNLNTIKNCVSADSTLAGTGYKFNGLVTGLNFVNNSIEGAAIGVEFNGEVRGATIQNCYAESWSDVAIKISSNFVAGLEITGCYWNFLNNATAYFMDYTEGPSNNFVVSQSNSFVGMVSEANYFKNVHTTVGYNQFTFYNGAKNSTSINDFVLNNTYYSPEADYIQTINQAGLRTEVVNKYAKGVYGGKYTNGFTSSNGFTWVNTSSSTLRLTTRILPSDTQLIYVNINVNVSGVGIVNIKGQFVGNDFYEYNGTALTKTTTLNVTTVSGYLQINGTMANTISTQVIGEVRLI